ncbi:MAG: CoA transferase [Proteobacteria bacterium]|nr:CoA transferase [Pseudomonadota bacterium]
MNFAQSQTEPVRNGNRSRDMAPHGSFPCAGEDRWISIACRDDQEFNRLAALMGLDDPRFASLSGRAAEPGYCCLSDPGYRRYRQ